MTFINTLYDFVTEPSKAVDDIIKSRSLALALLGYAAGSLSVMIMWALGGGGMGNFAFTFGFFAVLFVDLCIGFFVASSAHLLLEISTGKGSALGLFTLIGLSQFCLTLLVSFALMQAAAPVLAVFKFLVLFIVALLQIYFILYMMNKAYGLSKVRTFFTLILSLAPAVLSLFAACGAFFFLLFWMIF